MACLFHILFFSQNIFVLKEYMNWRLCNSAARTLYLELLAAHVCSAYVSTKKHAEMVAASMRELCTVLVSLHRVNGSTVLDAALRHNAL